jgi:hypothetical protein
VVRVARGGLEVRRVVNAFTNDTMFPISAM